MKIGDYITVETLDKIGSEKYEALRSYLRFLGYSINPGMGNYFDAKVQESLQSLILSSELCVCLNKFSNLELERKGKMSGRELSLDEVENMISLSPINNI